MNLQWPLSAVIFGKPRCGKTTLVQYIANKHRNEYDHVIVIGPTIYQGGYDFLKDRKHTLLKPIEVDKKISHIMAVQEKTKKLYGRTSRILLIFDDCAGILGKSGMITNLMSCYRHFSLSVVYIAQYVYSIPQVTRNLCQYAMIFQQNNANSLKECYESYFGEMGSLREFKDYFTKLFDAPYKFCFVDTNTGTHKMLRCPN